MGPHLATQSIPVHGLCEDRGNVLTSVSTLNCNEGELIRLELPLIGLIGGRVNIVPSDR
jgi:hypothetical protein